MTRQPISQLFADLHDRWGMFPNQTTLGSYDFFSQSVRLDSVHPDHLMALDGSPFGALPTVQALKKFVPVACHEYAHWMDMNCTLYGLRILRELALCYRFNPDLNREAWNAEGQFFHAKRVADAITQIRLPEYYSVTFPSPASRPWKYKISVGHGYDATGKPNSDPIVFLRFSGADGQPIARQPLSMASILEANATYNELVAVHSTNLLISNPDEKLIEEKTDAQKIIDQIYEPGLTLYSVAAHLCAAAGQLSDIASAYKAAAVLSRFALNSPQSRLQVFKATKSFSDKVGNGIAVRVTDSIRHGNVEALFFYASQVFNWSSTSLSDPESDVAELSRICFQIGLEELRNEIHVEAEILTSAISDSTFPDAKTLSDAALENCIHINKCGGAGYKFDELHIPPCFMSNDLEMSIIPAIKQNLLSGISITDRFYSLYDNESWIRKFSKACYPRQNLLA